MAYVVMAYIVMAYLVTAYVVMADIIVLLIDRLSCREWGERRLKTRSRLDSDR